MKVQLKNFPNGGRCVYENVEFVKHASKLRDHFCLVEANLKDGETPMCLYLHRNTYVEPVQSTYKI